nr:sterol desaturase family protein [Sphingomonas sp. GC_Shp_3]
MTILTICEILNSREEQSLRGRWIGVAYWIVLVVTGALFSTALELTWNYFHVYPMYTLPVLAASSWSRIFTVPLVILVGALFQYLIFYLYHRAQHCWFWRWHAVHHSIQELNAVNSYHHVSEGFMSLILVQIPMSLVVVDTGPQIPFVNLVLWLHTVWIHSPTRFNFGPLRMFFADNRFHRIHHSLEPQHFDKNFGAFTTLWDQLFGTCRFPEANDWPAVGLAEVLQPNTLREWWDLPARYQRATKPASSNIGSAADLPGPSTASLAGYTGRGGLSSAASWEKVDASA